jgi:molybdopterin molybdotransferase
MALDASARLRRSTARQPVGVFRMKTWGPDARPLVSLAEAWATIARHMRPLDVERVELSDAPGRTLRESIVAPEDAPPFDRAMMDGYAVRSADCAAPGARLRVVGRADAGGVASRAVAPGEAVRINTGAALPAGADAVIAVENTEPLENGTTVLIRESCEPNRHVCRHGEFRTRGDVLVSAPCRIHAGTLAAIASAGIATVTVSRVPDTTIVSTGDELVPPGMPRGEGRVYESNSVTLAALLRSWGATPHATGIVHDEPAALRTAFSEALRSPLVLTVGGMSMGTRDLVPGVMRDLGVTWRFHGVDMRPGKPTAYGVGPAGQHILGLPGNPVSAFVCAWLFARMIVHGLTGLPAEPPAMIRASLAVELKPHKDPRPAFVPAGCRHDPSEGFVVEPTRYGGSGDSFGLASANGLLYRPRPTEAAPRGSSVEVILLADVTNG